MLKMNKLIFSERLTGYYAMSKPPIHPAFQEPSFDMPVQQKPQVNAWSTSWSLYREPRASVTPCLKTTI